MATPRYILLFLFSCSHSIATIFLDVPDQVNATVNPNGDGYTTTTLLFTITTNAKFDLWTGRGDTPFAYIDKPSGLQTNDTWSVEASV